MSKTHFSSALFEQIGGTNWQAKADFDFTNAQQQATEAILESTATPVFDEEPSEISSEDNPISLVLTSDQVPEPNMAVRVDLAEPSSVQKDFEQGGGVKEDSADYKDTLNERVSIVLLGMGLDSVWQNEENLAWLLWQNIMQAFNWDESSVVFFDTANLVSEDMVFETMEEIIELGVERVFTMDEEHLISEQLQEGVQVITVPDLESMLSDPYAKQSFYQSVMMSSTLN